MKRSLLWLLCAAFFVTSCTTVDSGTTGVKINYGGQTEMSKVYPEDMYMGINWLWDDMVEYETREMTLNIQDTYLDIDGLEVPVEVAVYFNPDPSSVNKLHKEIGPDYINRKVLPAANAALKTVIPQYKALELNTKYREEADKKIKTILEQKFPEFYVNFNGVNITKLSIPREISQMIIAKQKQDEANLLAEKKELEQKNLANAEIARAKGQYEAATYDAKTKDILSQPKMIELYRAETERIWAQKGVSPYGNNNVFGNAGVLKGGYK